MNIIKNRIIPIFLIIIMFGGTMPTIHLKQVRAAGMTLQQLQVKFPHGRYWNHVTQAGGHGGLCYSSCNNPNGTTGTPCYSHKYAAKGGQCDCNTFDGGSQCCGFARKLAYDAYGSSSNYWPNGNLSTLKPGDVIHYEDGGTDSEYGHWAFVIGVNGNAITLGEANAFGNCRINWGRVIYKNAIKVKSIKSAPYTLPNGQTQPVTPATPKNISINKTEMGIGDAITATWSGSSGATKYNVNLVCTSNSVYNQSQSVGGTAASFSIKNPGTYKVTVSASNSAGTSGSNSSGNCVVHDNVSVKYVDWENQTIGAVQSIKWGGNAIAPTAPEREGYTFQNWSSDGKNIKSNTTINSVYKINTYAVSFVDYNGDVIDKVQKVEYMSAATEPTDIPTKNGYVFAGWDTSEYQCVKKSLTVRATYVWENSDLPIITEINSAKRNDEGTGYTIDVNLTNFPDDFTKGKLVVALMTKSGKMVASETRSISMPETEEVSEKITVLYSGLASKVQVSMIGVVDDETTGTPKSKIVMSAVDIGNEWSDWSATVPEGDDIIKESRTEYRYKDSKVIKSTGTPTTPSGYSLTKTENTGTYTSWGSWSGWSRNWVGSNVLTNVQTTTGYRYYAFRCSNCGTQDPYSGACSNCGGSMYWVEEWGTTNGYNYGYTAVNSSKGKIYWMNRWWYFEFNGCSDG